MPSDETRRLLRMFGVAVTSYEDAIDSAATPEELRRAQAEARARLEEVAALIDRLSTKNNDS